MSNKNKVKNAALVAKGHVNVSTGMFSRSSRLEKDGKVDRVIGNMKQSGERFNDAVKK
jgi:uncharacterized protein YjbJ (UPF0337 family)